MPGLPLLPLLLAIPGFPVPAPAPSLDAILARHFEARGGLARILALHGIRSTGRVSVGGVDLVLRVENPRGAFRSDTTFQGLTKTEAFDGRQGWIADPFTGAPDPKPMDAAQLRQVRLQADFDGPLVGWQAKGHRVALLGLADVDGAPAYVLKVRLAEGGELTSFLDAKTFLEVKAVNEAVADGKTVQVETRLSDYRAVAGVLLPFRLEIRPQGQAGAMVIQFDAVAPEDAADPSIFRRPSPR